jgi:hypothetical protein
MITQFLFPTLQQHLNTQLPDHLWHYTSTAGLIGIVKSKKVWASQILMMNDAMEYKEGLEMYRLMLYNKLNNKFSGQLSAVERSFLEHSHSTVGATNSNFYVFSLSTLRDSLSQWRAYAQDGGFSIGFPAAHLKTVAATQQFVLAPCIYDHQLKGRILSEIVNFSLNEFLAQAKNTNEDNLEKLKETLSSTLMKRVAGVAPFFKHRAFDEESEWRLVSPPLPPAFPEIGFRPGAMGLIRHYEFNLVTPENPRLCTGEHETSLVVVVGPGLDITNQISVQALLSHYLGPGCGHGPSDAPFRTSK